MPAEVAYLACPFSHPEGKVRRYRHRAVTYVTGHLIRSGRLVYSPLTHNIPLHSRDDTGDWQKWSQFDHSMVSRCDKVLLLKLPGWEESKGVAAELECARNHSIPIEELEPPTEVVSGRFALEAESVDGLIAKMAAFSKERDWDQWHSPKNLVMNLSAELGELAEHFRWLSEEESRELDEETHSAVKDEIGDLMIGLTYLAHKLSIDPVDAAIQKIDKLGKRYPPGLARASRDKR